MSRPAFRFLLLMPVLTASLLAGPLPVSAQKKKTRPPTPAAAVSAAANALKQAESLVSAGKFAEAVNLLNARRAAIQPTQVTPAVLGANHAVEEALADTRFAWAQWLMERKQVPAAIAQYEAAYMLDQRLRPRNAALELNTLGDIYRSLGDNEKAVGRYEKAALAYRELSERGREARLFNTLGDISANLNQPEKAVGYYEQALTAAREAPDKDIERAALNSAAYAYQSLKQPEKAVRYFEQELAIHRESKDRAREATALNNLGLAYDSLNQVDTAIRYFEQAQVIQRELRDRRSEANTLNNLGYSYQSLSMTDKAIECYEQALVIEKAVGDRQGEGVTLGNLMTIFRAADTGVRNVPLAIFYGKQSVNAYQEIRGNLQEVDRSIQQDFLKQKEGVYGTLAELLKQQQRLFEARQVLTMLNQDMDARPTVTQAKLSALELEAAARIRKAGERVADVSARYNELMKKKERTDEETTQMSALETELTASRTAFHKVLDNVAVMFASRAQSKTKK